MVRCCGSLTGDVHCLPQTDALPAVEVRSLMLAWRTTVTLSRSGCRQGATTSTVDAQRRMFRRGAGEAKVLVLSTKADARFRALVRGTFADPGLCRTNLTASWQHIVPTASEHFVQVVVRQVYGAAR